MPSLSQAILHEAIRESSRFAVDVRRIRTVRENMADIQLGRLAQIRASNAGMLARVEWESKNSSRLYRVFA